MAVQYAIGEGLTVKALTHYVFSAGSAFYLLAAMGLGSAGSFLLAAWLSLSVNFLIDFAGHGLRSGRPRRSALTHSVFTGPLWGAVVGSLSASVFGLSTSRGQLVLWGAYGAFVAMTHLFLDSLTEGGVYLTSHRIAIAHFRYNNAMLNASFVLLGGLLALLSFV